MADTSVASGHAQLAAAVRAATAGEPKPVYLLTGEPSETLAAAHALLDALVPPAHRAFNLESYDGRTTPIATVIDSLRTPGFFPGTKVVWVRESTLFLSGEKRAEVTAALLAACDDGREQEAAEKLLTLVALAGWSQEQFQETRWSALAKTRIREVFGEELDDAARDKLDVLQAVCRARELSVGAYRDESGALLEFLDTGMPPHVVLVFTAAAVDARKRLYKWVRDVGAVVDLGVARERSGMLSRDSVDAVVRRVTRDLGKQMQPAAQELIGRRAGGDMAMLASELEKLCLYVGERVSIAEDDVRAVFRDMAESWIFDFTSALATRQLARALPLLRGLIRQGEPPLRLLAMIAREVRLLLLARECIDQGLRGVWRPDLTFNVFQSRVVPRLDPETVSAFGK